MLAGYTSAVALLGIAALMAFSSVERLFAPAPIHYREAIVIAVIGLVVNLCALSSSAASIIMATITATTMDTRRRSIAITT